MCFVVGNARKACRQVTLWASFRHYEAELKALEMRLYIEPEKHALV